MRKRRVFGRQTEVRSISISPHLWSTVERWARDSGLSKSAAVSTLIELHSDHSIRRKKHGFGWIFEPPKWREDEENK